MVISATDSCSCQALFSLRRPARRYKLEVTAQIRYQMRRELSGIHVQPSVDLERCRQREDDPHEQAAQVDVCWALDVTSRWQTSYGALMSIITATSACSSTDCVHMTVWYGSTTAVATSLSRNWASTAQFIFETRHSQVVISSGGTP